MSARRQRRAGLNYLASDSRYEPSRSELATARDRVMLRIIRDLAPEALCELEKYIEQVVDRRLREHAGKRWMTVAGCAEYLGISEVAVRRRITRGRIPTVRQGRSVLIDREALDRELGRAV